MYSSTIYASSRDAHTITDGPAIFLCQDTERVGRFLLQQAAVPEAEVERLGRVIALNRKLQGRLSSLELRLEDHLSSDISNGRSNRLGREDRGGATARDLRTAIQEQASRQEILSLAQKYIPNKVMHLRRFVSDPENSNAFTSSLSEDDIAYIMSLDKVTISQKLLLMLGIGVFGEDQDAAYLEVVKQHAAAQKLYLIVASTDYMYGTNYQFCHGYVGADLMQSMSREKCIQAFGRVGRGRCQQTYSIRIRNNDVIRSLFSEPTESPERDNMVKLLI